MNGPPTPPLLLTNARVVDPSRGIHTMRRRTKSAS
jgi:hypothetical protein